jgi:hypothetical protein
MVLRWLLGIGDNDEECPASKAVYAKNEGEALDRAKRIAQKEGIQGTPEVEEKPDIAGGSYYSVTWRKDG